MEPATDAPHFNHRAKNRPSVLHVISEVTLGGASRAMIGLAKYGQRDGNFRHEIISLGRADRRAVGLACDAGVPVIKAPQSDRLHAAIAGADIVQLHFWNDPDIHAMLQTSLPRMRSVAWCHVNGLSPPHLITADVFEAADLVVASTAATLELSQFRAAASGRTALVGGGADFERVAHITKAPGTGFTVGHIGLLDFTKLHPDFIAMSATVAGAHFIVCGEGSAEPELRRQAEALGAERRFDFRGYVEDLSEHIAAFDVFGYPLCEGNFSTTELVLQEVMHAGIPPVVLPYGGAADLVVHGESGLVARDPADYAAALRHLQAHPDERDRLGRNAAARARALYGARNTARQFEQIYAELMHTPKHDHRPRSVPSDAVAARSPAAFLLIDSLAEAGEPFLTSCTAQDETVLFDADRAIADAGVGIGNVVLHYRARFPDDGCLALWAGLVLRRRRRPALAIAEFSRAMRRPESHWRAAYYLAGVAREIGAHALLSDACEQVRRAAPHRAAELS